MKSLKTNNKTVLALNGTGTATVNGTLALCGYGPWVDPVLSTGRLTVEQVYRSAKSGSTVTVS